MYYFGYDPQTAKGKFCEVCGREHFEEGELCARCADRLADDTQTE